MARKSPRAAKNPVSVESWWPRFWAWFIDIIIVSVVVYILLPWNADVTRVTASGLVLLAYFTVFESNGRQTLGKKALGLRLAGKDGRKVSLEKALLSAFGKSFLLPLDFLIGVLARPGQKQRLFNIASDTIVIRDVR